MNGPPPKETVALLKWLRETFGLIATDIRSGRAATKDLRKCMGFMEALRIDTREEVKLKARALDGICVRELSRRRLATTRSWLDQLQNVASARLASFSDSSTDVAAEIDAEILEELRDETRDLRRHWSVRIFRRMCRQLRRIAS